MARELGPDGITVNSLLPGATFTEIERKTVTPAQKERIIAMQCIPRAETPEDLVGSALFLASEASAFVTGQVHQRRRRRHAYVTTPVGKTQEELRRLQAGAFRRTRPASGGSRPTAPAART